MKLKLKVRPLVTIPLSVSGPVSGLQFNIVTNGAMASLGTQTIASILTAADTYKVLVFVTTNTTFNGPFMQVSGGDTTITSISDVLASDIDGNEVAGVSISY